MKSKLVSTIFLLASLALLALSASCAKEISHTESDKPGWFGGRTQEKTTVYQNPDGTTSTSHEKKTTNP